MKTVFHAVHSACFRLELPCLQCIQGTTSRASMWFNCPSSICSKRSLPTGVTPRTQLDKQIRRQQCKQWQPWDFEARCNFLLYSYNPGAIAHSAFNFFHDNKVPFRRLQNLTILKRKNSKLNRHKKPAQHLVNFTKFVDFPWPKHSVAKQSDIFCFFVHFSPSAIYHPGTAWTFELQWCPASCVPLLDF